jgi:hypothetical protein
MEFGDAGGPGRGNQMMQTSLKARIRRTRTRRGVKRKRNHQTSETTCKVVQRKVGWHWNMHACGGEKLQTRANQKRKGKRRKRKRRSVKRKTEYPELVYLAAGYLEQRRKVRKKSRSRT